MGTVVRLLLTTTNFYMTIHIKKKKKKEREKGNAALVSVKAKISR